jgi:hypothetical protein
MTTEKGGPAFPSKKRIQRAGYATQEFEPVDGMTLRDYFASKAMEGIFASNTEHDHEDAVIFDVVAEAAYRMADAMLEARKA